MKAETASLVAAATLLPLADACGVRRVPMRPPPPGDLSRRKNELGELKDNCMAALESGVLKKSDLPAEVVEAWGL